MTPTLIFPPGIPLAPLLPSEPCWLLPWLLHADVSASADNAITPTRSAVLRHLKRIIFHPFMELVAESFGLK
jgi:hypothetical protein